MGEGFTISIPMYDGRNPIDTVQEMLEGYFQGILRNISKEALISILVISLIVSILQCFFGYKLYKLWISLVSALIFAGIGVGIVTANGMSENAIIGGAIAGAVLGALIGFFLWRVGFFLLVLSMVFLVVAGICFAQGMESLSIIIALAVGLICAILAMVLVKPILILYTGITGGFAAAESLLVLFEIEWKYFIPLIGAVLTVAGVIVQFLTNRRRVNRSMGNDATVPFFTAQTEMLKGEKSTAEEPVYAESFETAPVGENVVMTEETVQLQQETVQQPEAAAFGEEKAQPEAVIVCEVCGAQYPTGTKFCMKCGQKLG